VMRDWIYKSLMLVGGCGFLLLGAFCLGLLSGERVRINRGEADFQSIRSALVTYAINAGRPATTEQGLEALVTRPSLEPLPEDWVKIADRVPTDPWRQPYHYRLLSEAEGAFRWELRSIGPDGIAGNEDDLAREFEWEGR
jgi:general secretion pathway protein G